MAPNFASMVSWHSPNLKSNLDLFRFSRLRPTPLPQPTRIETNAALYQITCILYASLPEIPTIYVELWNSCIRDPVIRRRRSIRYESTGTIDHVMCNGSIATVASCTGRCIQTFVRSHRCAASVRSSTVPRSKIWRLIERRESLFTLCKCSIDSSIDGTNVYRSRRSLTFLIRSRKPSMSDGSSLLLRSDA